MSAKIKESFDDDTDFDYFEEIGHGQKIQIEQTIKFCEINEYSIEFIDKKDKIAENLSWQIEDLVRTMEKLIVNISKQHKSEIKILEEQVILYLIIRNQKR